VNGLVTPRAVLREIKNAADKPWWVSRMFNEVEEHLKRTRFKGCWLLDTPMTPAACEAVIEEAVDVVRKPKSTEQLLAEFDRTLGRVGPL
jgi:hypothetical protein